jgi:prevent-host-death family protein
MQGVAGSSPASSTDGLPADGMAVGAHEFRNHFGYYLERAAAGHEVSVARHGRPYAKLVAA